MAENNGQQKMTQQQALQILVSAVQKANQNNFNGYSFQDSSLIFQAISVFTPAEESNTPPANVDSGGDSATEKSEKKTTAKKAETSKA